MGLQITIDGSAIALDAATEAEILEVLLRQERAQAAQEIIAALATKWTAWRTEGGDK